MNDMQQMETETHNIGKYWNDILKNYSYGRKDLMNQLIIL